MATNLPHSLPPMPASERRLVHLRLANHPQVVTSSEGTGRHRSVIVSPKV
jgi:spoIIIJ-associated protein